MPPPTLRQRSSPWQAWRLPAAMILCLLALGVGQARAVTHLKRGAPAPEFALKDSSGTEVSTATLRGRTVVVIFGELYHEKTRQACGQTVSVVQEARFTGQPVTVLLITTQDAKPDDAKPAADQKLPSIVLRDPNRQAFGAYQVAVMPSAVVIDKEGRVVHAEAGLTARFADVLTDALLLATGKLSALGFEQALNPPPTTAPGESNDVRAQRLAFLARQLVRRGMDDLALQKYTEALQLSPQLPQAHLELGMLLLNRRRLAEAEAHFRTVLAAQPKDSQAALGLAFVQTLRGGAELDVAERTAREMLARNPVQPRVHYLLGLILQQRGKPEDAAASFKKAAELLLERSEQE